MECPKCGKVNGYQENVVLSCSEFYEFSGECLGHSELHYIKGGKRKHCVDCGKDITDFVNKLKAERENG